MCGGVLCTNHLSLQHNPLTFFLSVQYSAELRDLVAQMLSREPKDRPSLVRILKAGTCIYDGCR